VADGVAAPSGGGWDRKPALQGREGEIANPEIQRPFVWDASQVRDPLDSLYEGFPVGYLIAWRNPDVTLKDGSTASGHPAYG
jgi:uncharacterized protein with ParB-like and HNH nuclease domain